MLKGIVTVLVIGVLGFAGYMIHRYVDPVVGEAEQEPARALPAAPTSAEIRARIEEEIVAAQPEIMELLRDGFPSEFATYVDRMARLVETGQGTDERFMAEGALFAAKLRKENAPKLRNLPPDRLRTMLRAHLEGLQVIRSELGAERCGLFQRDGMAALRPEDATQEFLGAIGVAALEIFRGLVDARDAETRRPEATDEDRAEIAGRLIEAGVSEADIALARAPDGSPDACPAMENYYTGLLELEGDAADRVIGDLLVNAGAPR